MYVIIPPFHDASCCAAHILEPRLDSSTVNPDMSSTGPDSPDSPDRCQECQPDSPDSARHHFLAKPDRYHALLLSSSVKLVSSCQESRQPDSSTARQCPTVPDRTDYKTRQCPDGPQQGRVIQQPDPSCIPYLWTVSILQPLPLQGDCVKPEPWPRPARRYTRRYTRRCTRRIASTLASPARR